VYMQALEIQKLRDFLYYKTPALTMAYSHLWLLPWLAYADVERMSVWIYILSLSIALAVSK